MQDFSDKYTVNVGIYGIGESTRSALSYLRERYKNIRLTVRCDTAPDSAKTKALSPYKVIVGYAARQNIFEDILLFSPSVRRDGKGFDEALNNGCKFTSDAEIFFNEFHGDVIGITGSDGKSTTTYLISAMLNAGGVTSVPCGNFGTGFCPYLGKDIMPVAELSSFQLFYLKPTLDTAVITNITENHLNWHKDFEEYKNTKLKIASHAEKVIYDADCDELRKGLSDKSAFAVISLEKDYESLKKTVVAENYITCSHSLISINGKPCIDIRGAKRSEGYNLRNYMLSTAAVLTRVTPDICERVIRDFIGLPHRAELIGCYGGINYINSSIDTTPERSAKTLSSFSQDTVAIICGKDKGTSPSPLIEALIARASGAVLMGEMGDMILSKLSADSRFSSYPVKMAKSMEDAVKIGSEMLTRGGTLILSPGATSYDKYNNFSERGEDFRRAVKEYIKNGIRKGKGK